MDSQNPEDWELPLSQPPFDPGLPSTSRRRVRDEAEPSERRVQPRTDPDPSVFQFAAASIQLDTRTLVIVLEAESTLSGGYQMIFEGCFENNIERRMVSRISSEVGHRLWLQGQLSHLSSQRRASFVSEVILQILEFLHV